MNWRIVRVLVAKDLTLFFRNRYFALITGLAVFAYAGIYFAMPASVDEKLAIGLYAPQLPPVLEELQQEEGLTIEQAESEEALKDAVIEGRLEAGIILSAEAIQKLLGGQKARIELYFPSDAPDEFKEAIITLVRELAYLQSGQVLTVEVSEQVLGRDMLGNQIPPRDRMLPLFAVFIIMAETLGLASLISEEVEGRTVTALMVTPVNVRGFFAAKGVSGVGLAFLQAALLMAVTGGLNQQPVILLLALLLGACLATGVGFLMAALGKDLMSVMAWGIPVMLILSVPAFGVLLPGTVSDWIKVIPSYYLSDTVHLSANFGLGWDDVWQNLLILLGFNAVIISLGIAALRRKLQ